MNALALLSARYCHLLFFPNFRSRLLCNSSVFSGRTSARSKQPVKTAQFVEHFHHVLDVPKIEGIAVLTETDCLLRCMRNDRCFSANVAAFPRSDGNVWPCDLLPTDKYNASDKFKANHTFHHYSIMVSRTYFSCQ